MAAHRLQPTGSARRALALALAAALLAAVAHANALGNPFVFDDVPEVVDNASIERLSDPGAILRRSLTRPVVNLSYALDYRAWGGRDPFGFHVTNLALHVANVLLLFVLVFPTAAARGAFVAAALWAVHPLMTEAVGYVASRSEVLCGAFVLASLVCFQRAFTAGDGAAGLQAGRSRSGGSWLAGGLACFLLALGTKETAVVLPAVLLAWDRLIAPGTAEAKRARLWRLHAPLLALVATAGLVRVWLFVGVEYAGAERAGLASALTSVHAIARYLQLLAAPVGQSIVPPIFPVVSPLDPRFVVSAGVIAALWLAAWLLRRRVPLAAFGLVWFFLLILPSSALTLLSEYGQSIAEHRAYLASAGIFMAAGALAARWAALPARTPGARRAAAAVLAVVLGVLLGLTVARNRVWADPVALWADAERKAPGAWVAVYGLADAHRQAGDCPGALGAYARALRLAPLKAETYVGMAACLAETGRVDEAAAILRLGLSRLPDHSDMKLRLAGLEERAFGDLGRALALCREVLEADAASGEARDCVGRVEDRLSAKGR